jgi:hypothetical protein
LVRNIDCLRELKVKIAVEEIAVRRNLEELRGLAGWSGSGWGMARTAKASIVEGRKAA